MASMRLRFLTLALATGTALAALPAVAAEVTFERLRNADKEPQNWLMNHGTYDGQRYSALARINKDNVKNLKLAYAVPLGGGAGNEFNEATPVVEDGFLYITDSWSVVYKIDVRSGTQGRIVWRMDPKQDRQFANRGIALAGNYVISVASQPARVIATDKETGKVAWETNVSFGEPAVTVRAAPLVIKDKVLIGAAGSSIGLRQWIAAVDVANGNVVWQKFTIPAPGEPGSETWKDKINAWQSGGGSLWVTGTYDTASNQTIWGTGNPVPEYDPTARPGDNLYTNSAISYDPDIGKMNWYFQYTPNDSWDFDEVGTHIIFDAVINGQQRRLITHSARNGFLYTMERGNGQIVTVKPYMDDINWTKGIDQKTGRPLDYDPSKDVQTYAGVVNINTREPKKLCPGHTGSNNFWPSSYSQKTKLIYIPAQTGCEIVTVDTSPRVVGRSWTGGGAKKIERLESDLVAADPVTGEVKKKIHLPYPNHAGTFVTAGGIVVLALMDGTVAAYDDTTLAELWKINMGSGFSAPPMTFETGGKQYIAVMAGPSATARLQLINTPEMREQRHATVLYVFGL